MNFFVAITDLDWFQLHAANIGVDPDEHGIVISKHIREQFESGRDYYQLHGRTIALPSEPYARPSRDCLQFHAETVFR